MHKETPKRYLLKHFGIVGGGQQKILEAPHKVSDLKEQNQKGIG